MGKTACLLVALLFVVPTIAISAVHEVKPGLKVQLPELPEPWVVTREAPAPLVNHFAEHLKEDAAKKGHTLSDEKARAAARERLASNELLVYNPQSEAHVMISFSPLNEGESAPSARAISTSAKYAAEGVTDEGWSDVSSRQKDIAIQGAQHAQGFEIDYTEDGHPSAFLGVVGFAPPYWFWIYGNDHLKSPADRAVLEKVLREIEIEVAPSTQ